MNENPTKKITELGLALAIALSSMHLLPAAALADDLSVSGEGNADGGGEGLDGEEIVDDGMVSTSSGDECGGSAENSRC